MRRKMTGIPAGPRRPALLARYLALIAAAALALLTAPAALARESLGLFGGWGAFRDANVPRCYAIAMPRPSGGQADYAAYADVSIWPARKVRNQVHVRAARRLQPGQKIVLLVGTQRFELTGGGGDAWAADRRMDAAIVAAMRSAARMTLTARDSAGRRFSNTWELAGAGSAMDAAAIGCARVGSP